MTTKFVTMEHLKLLESAERMLLAINLATGLRPDTDVYKNVRLQYGGSMASAWLELRKACVKASVS